MLPYSIISHVDHKHFTLKFRFYLLILVIDFFSEFKSKGKIYTLASCADIRWSNRFFLITGPHVIFSSLVARVKSYQELNTSWLLFNAFIVALIK